MKKSTSPKGDTTQKERIARRRAKLNQIAGKAGYYYKGKPSWSAYETAVINQRAKLPRRAAGEL